MRILYHLTVPPSPIPACDAVMQEVQALQQRFGGEVSYLYPGRTPGTRFPRRWWGIHRLPYLLRAEAKIAFHHVYNPDPFSFGVLRFLRRPIVYTVVAGVRNTDQDAAQRLTQHVHTLVVSTETELNRLQGLGVQAATVVRPGIDVSRFSYTPSPSDSPPTLLVGSAPWTREQFRTKGVDALLKLAQQMPELRLVFLWRGVLTAEMERQVQSAGLDGRVEVLNEHVDVNAVLARVHAAVALADGDALIKAYPHSLLEALAAGRPVLVSRSIPMSQFVEQRGCGVIVERTDVSGVRHALETLLLGYRDYQQRALNVGAHYFSLERLLAAYGRIYESVGQ